MIIAIRNIGIVVYLSKEISDVNTLQALNNFASLTNVFAQVGMISRSLDVTRKLNITGFFTLSELNNTIIELGNYQNTLLPDYGTWSYCQASDIINDNIIPY